MPNTLIFLPGAGGHTDLWRPVADRLRHAGERRFVTWPGFGGPADPDVDGIDDLVDRVAASITGPVDILAQSMGGIVAIRAALRMPAFVKHLVLSVTSGGMDVAGLGGSDWRPGFLAQNPGVPRWFIDDRSDLTPQLDRVRCPVLLLWGNEDPISPVAVGRRLVELLPNATLVVVAGGTHELISERADEVAPRIDAHLGTTPTVVPEASPGRACLS